MTRVVKTLSAVLLALCAASPVRADPYDDARNMADSAPCDALELLEDPENIDIFGDPPSSLLRDVRSRCEDERDEARNRDQFRRAQRLFDEGRPCEAFEILDEIARAYRRARDLRTEAEYACNDPYQRDSDGDGTPDANDNCFEITNPDQSDRDADGTGDVCDDDDDNDGISDSYDSCPNSPEDFDNFQDSDGCPEDDNDYDGVRDGADNCPLTPNADQHDLDRNGVGDACDNDRDGDNIDDSYDSCPREAEDYDGWQDGDGCPDYDNDSDGFPDIQDLNCPNSAEDYDGVQDWDGCPEDDADFDGLADSYDQCPEEAEDYDGVYDEDGCFDGDRDGDYIDDIIDDCPDRPEDWDDTSDEDGCPEYSFLEHISDHYLRSHIRWAFMMARMGVLSLEDGNQTFHATPFSATRLSVYWVEAEIGYEWVHDCRSPIDNAPECADPNLSWAFGLSPISYTWFPKPASGTGDRGLLLFEPRFLFRWHSLEPETLTTFAISNRMGYAYWDDGGLEVAVELEWETGSSDAINSGWGLSFVLEWSP